MDENVKQEDNISALLIESDAAEYEKTAKLFHQWFGNYLLLNRVSTFAQGLKEINTDKYDLILTEVIFPSESENPRQTIHTIMEQPGSADIPVIVFTSCPDSALSINAFRNGVAEYFTKFDLNKPFMEYRVRNLLQREYRFKIMNRQFSGSMHRFQKTHGMSQAEIEELNDLVAMMKKELENEYDAKMKAEEERNKVQSLFGMYVDPAIVKGVMNNEISVDKGKVQEISVMFTDIRGYTTLSENMAPAKVLTFLNEYFTSMTEVLMGYDGMIDKYIGDSIMALFGAPIWRANHCDDALQAAIEMQGVFQVWQGTWEKNYGIKPYMGIGLAAGEAIVGNVGSFQKISYTAVGDTVNIASRLESISKPGEVLISEKLYQGLSQKIREKYVYETKEPIQIKGKTGMYQTYSVIERI